MGPVFKKLNLKDHDPVLVLHAPPSFEPELASLEGRRVLRVMEEAERVPFAVVFATRRTELDALSAAVAERLVGDAVLWVAYPKKSSKRYQADFDRDRGWEVLGAAGFEPVRQVAIDEDWSALRFRRVEHIKRLTRKQTISEAGKRRRSE